MDPGLIFIIDTSFTVTCLLDSNHCLPHHTFNPLLQQTGELDNLTIRWGKVLSLCCAGLSVACNTCVAFPSSFWFDNLGLYWGKTCCLLLHTLLLGFPTKCSTSVPSTSFLAPLPGRPRTSSLGESFTSFLFTLFLVCFVSFVTNGVPYNNTFVLPWIHLANKN